MKFDLKSIITSVISLGITFAFVFIVITTLTDDMAQAIVSTFLTVATSVIGFYIGYQTNKKGE